MAKPIMTIDNFFRQRAFDVETVQAMGKAYEVLLVDLGISDRNDPVTQIIAKDIIQVASFGVRDAEEIRARVLNVFAKAIL